MKTESIAILGTDTGVGKTVVTGALAVALGRKGVDVAVYKPVATGCIAVKRGLVSQDALWFRRIIRVPDTLWEINPVAYRRPLAPWPAARAEGRTFPERTAIRGYERLCKSGRTVLVEGIGGVLVPLSKNRTIADLCARLKLPAVLVARAGLGTINHVLLSIEALNKRNVEVRGIILNMACGRDPAEKSNPFVISSLSGVPVLAVLPKIGGGSPKRAGIGRLASRFRAGTLNALFRRK